LPADEVFVEGLTAETGDKISVANIKAIVVMTVAEQNALKAFPIPF